MKQIQESFSEVKSIVEYINSDRVDEGLKDILKAVKAKFKAAFEYLKGVVAKMGVYFCPVNANGEIMPAISPLTAGQAYKEGLIKKDSTFVMMDKAGQKITGLKTNYKDALALYGSGNSISYWVRALKECEAIKDFNTVNENAVNEVKLHNSDPQAKYNIIVDDDQLKKRISMAIKNRKLARLLIWGAPGIGKTAILNNVLNEMRTEFPDFALIVKTLSSDTPDNFTLPTYTETPDGRRAEDVPKTWMPVYKPSGDPAIDAQLDEACGKGLLFIDELSRATPQVLNVILPLVNEGYFNGYKIGSGWTIVCASNRMDDEAAGQSELGNALVNRFSQVYYEPTVHTWRKWADKQNFISPLLLQWLSMPESENMSGGKFFYYDPNEEIDDENVTKIMCTPRSWTNAMELLCVYAETATLEGFTIFDIPTDIIAMALNECVPATAVDSFLGFLDVIRKIGNFDDAVYDVWQNGGKRFKLDKKDLNKVTLPLAQLICSAHSDKLPTADEFKNLAEWLVSQNSDQLASYVLDVYKNVFMGMCPDEETRNMLFVYTSKKAKLAASNPAVMDVYKVASKKFCDAWQITDDQIPDYSIGLKLIVAKYRDSFKSAVVGDHVDALG